MKYRLSILILVLSLSIPLAAQHVHEFSVNAGGGLSSLNYKPAYGKFTAGFGAEAGLGYHFFFSQKWGVGTGVNFSLYNSSTTMDSYSSRSQVTSKAGNPFDFAYAYTGYKESISAMLLTIPIMAQFQHPIAEKIQLYAAAGGKFGLPLSATCNTSGDLSTNAYFTGTNVTYYDDLPMKGFGNYDVDQDTDLELGVAVMLSLEIGAKWRINESLQLYTGAYLDYGVNNINKGETTNDLLSYNASAQSYPEGFNYGTQLSASDKVAPVAAGLKIRLSFVRRSSGAAQ